MSQRIAPGVICRINERSFHPENVGAIVTVVRPFEGEFLVETGDWYKAEDLKSWVILSEGRKLMTGDDLPDRHISVAKEIALTPITLPPGATTEDEAEPLHKAPAEAA